MLSFCHTLLLWFCVIHYPVLLDVSALFVLELTILVYTGQGCFYY